MSQRRTAMKSLLSVAVLLSVTACSASDDTTTETATPAPSSSVIEVPTRLDCERFGGGGERGYGSVRPKGTATPEEAVEPWVDFMQGTSFVLDDTSDTAWVLRADGSAKGVLELDFERGWFVSSHAACAD